jgi:hypothetical protein
VSGLLSIAEAPVGVIESETIVVVSFASAVVAVSLLPGDGR